MIAAWKGWATALPDAKASFDAAYASGNTVILELTWRGAHNGPLQMPSGAIPATGRKIEIRALQIVQLTPEGKTQRVRHYFDMATLSPSSASASLQRKTRPQCDSATVRLCDSTVRQYDSTTVRQCASTPVRQYDSAPVHCP